jgi:hypothetical protein
MVLKQNRSKKLDAPSWLWTSVVESVARLKSAYLEHCRQIRTEWGVDMSQDSRIPAIKLPKPERRFFKRGQAGA